MLLLYRDLLVGLGDSVEGDDGGGVAGCLGVVDDGFGFDGCMVAVWFDIDIDSGADLLLLLSLVVPR